MANKYKILYEDDFHKCIMFHFDDETHQDSFLSVNQYLIIQNNAAVLIDPGSEAIFDELYDAISEFIEISKIKFIFLSHQDPDVSASITQWSTVTQAKFIISALWVRFLSHYGFMDMARVIALPDKGAKVHFGKDALVFIPAHFLHSPGNFSLYDTRSQILFSGDIGAAVLPAEEGGEKTVHDFNLHVNYLEGFHKRYMASNKVCNAWCIEVKKLQPQIIAPQHGYTFENENVKHFLEWFSTLECGIDLVKELY